MKRIILALALLLILFISTAYAVDVDYTYVKDNNYLYEVNVNEDGNAFIAPVSNIEEITINHKYSLEQHPSNIQSDIIVIDYYGDANPVWRIWFNYFATKNLGISSVTIKMPKYDFDSSTIKTDEWVSYTFTGIGGKEHVKNYSGYIGETPCIIMGFNNSAFWFNLILVYEGLSSFDELMSLKFPVILHGALEDVETEITGMGHANLLFAAEAAYHISMEALINEDGTSMTSE